MRKVTVIFALIAICTVWSHAFAQQSKVARLEQGYLDGLFRAKPHLATFMGDHRFDGLLPDLSPAALKRRERELVRLRQDLEALRRTALSGDEQIDLEILADGIVLELLYLREIKDWEWDPRLYDSFPYYDPREIVASRLSDIIHGNFAPESERMKSVTAQLQALPVFLKQEMTALNRWRDPRSSSRKPSKIYVEQGIKANQGRIEFFENELKEFTGRNPAAESARARAVGALRGYQTFLEKELSPGADGDWRLGAALYRKKFPLALQTALTPDEVVRRATAAFHAARAELYQIARSLHQQLWPLEPQPVENADAATQAKVIARVKEELSKDHPRPEDLVAAHARNLDELRAFIEQHNLLALPPGETLSVESMPPFKRGVAAAEYLAPGVLDHRPVWHATYYVDPIDPTWPTERVESYLRGQNNYEIQLVASHEAYPGHHTQYFYSRRNLNPLRAVLWNGAMAEGWAVYGEGLIVKLGWGGSLNDRFRFYDLRGQMIVATNALLDIKLHSGQMTDEEAVRFMVEEGFQELALAEKKLVRAKLDSSQLAQYFLGLDEIKSLERDCRKQVGDNWSQRVFNEGLIGHGSIAVKFLRRYLLSQDQTAFHQETSRERNAAVGRSRHESPGSKAHSDKDLCCSGKCRLRLGPTQDPPLFSPDANQVVFWQAAMQRNSLPSCSMLLRAFRGSSPRPTSESQCRVPGQRSVGRIEARRPGKTPLHYRPRLGGEEGYVADSSGGVGRGKWRCNGARLAWKSRFCVRC